MNTKPQITTDACLLIFDPHQDVAWLRAIIEKERHRVSHLLLGGDYFDTDRREEVAGAETMCELLLEVVESWQDRVTVLLGNHDIHYGEAKRWCDQHRNPKHLNYKCSGYTNTKAKQIAKRLDWGFWQKCRLFQCINGWLVSHAGVAGTYWHSELELNPAIEALEGHCQVVMEKYPFHDFALLQAGQARGGDHTLGGITWLDFNFEFSDEEVPLPQIFGHTTSHSGARQKGRSWCLDGYQSCYGILHRSGELEVIGRP